MRLISVNAGRPMLMARGGRTVSTAINKRPIDGLARVTDSGIDGDHQANSRVHGGPQQAICVYPHEHYPTVAGWLGRDVLDVPSFGENFTTEGLLEDEVCIGDTYRVGAEAVVQVSQPREPCSNLAGKHGEPRLVRRLLEHGNSGFYLRVLKHGEIAAGDPIERIERNQPGLTVRRAVLAMFLEPPDVALVESFCGCAELSPKWRRRIAARLAAGDS